MALALRIRDLDEDTFAASAAEAKRCSGCDPDIPGACAPHRCPKCRGTMLEPLSFQSTVAQLSESRKEHAQAGNKKNGKRFGGGGRDEYGTVGDDDVQVDLEY